MAIHQFGSDGQLSGVIVEIDTVTALVFAHADLIDLDPRVSKGEEDITGCNSFLASEVLGVCGHKS